MKPVFQKLKEKLGDAILEVSEGPPCEAGEPRPVLTGGPPPVVEKSFLMDSVLGLGLVVIFVMGFYIPGPFQRLLLEAGRVAGGVIV